MACGCWKGPGSRCTFECGSTFAPLCRRNSLWATSLHKSVHSSFCSLPWVSFFCCVASPRCRCHHCRPAMGLPFASYCRPRSILRLSAPACLLAYSTQLENHYNPPKLDVLTKFREKVPLFSPVIQRRSFAHTYCATVFFFFTPRSSFLTRAKLKYIYN